MSSYGMYHTMMIPNFFFYLFPSTFWTHTQEMVKDNHFACLEAPKAHQFMALKE